MVENAYIHIPFCLRKCKYCSFVSGKSIEFKDKYIEALITEIKTVYKNEKLETLYFGGGTPSLLSYSDLKKLVEIFRFKNNSEITLEVNPETVRNNDYKKIRDIGFNRVSIGVQTFDNYILKYIGRCHTDKDIYESLNIIKNAGFDNVSTDLIYGLPFQTKEIFYSDLNKVRELNIQHVSTYGLKIENDSFFGKNPPANLPDDEFQADMYLYLYDFFNKLGFNHYEISNFARFGYESKHNNCYWENKNYYGFGLNASGFVDNVRYKNTSNLAEYLLNPLKKDETEELTSKVNMENEIFLSLRLKEGINIIRINKKYNIDFEHIYKNILKKYLNLNLLEKISSGYRLTKQGILLSNEVMSEFVSV